MARDTPDDADLLERLQRLERPVRYRERPPAGAHPFAHDPGTSSALVTAPHGTAHHRDGQLKREEDHTSGLARLLAAETGAHALYMTHRADDDANWDAQTPFKRKIGALVDEIGIRFLLDLHGMTARQNVGLVVGTLDGRSCPGDEAELCRALDEHGFRRIAKADAANMDAFRWDTYVLNHPRFTGGLRHHTVTRFASQELGVAAAQVEVSFANLIVERGPVAGAAAYAGNPEAIRATARALSTLVERLQAPP